MNENGEGAGISYVIMPIDILQDKNLTPSEKILYCYLWLFKKGVCFQSNEKLAEMTSLDESTIKRGLKKLSDMRYVFIELVNGNKNKRRIYVVLDNPKKLAYLSRKGMFSLDRKAEEPKPEPTPAPEPVVEKKSPVSMGARPRRADYASDEEYERAFYNWDKAVV